MVLELRKLSEDEKIKQQMEARADYESRIATAEGAGYRKGKREELISLVKDGLLAEDIAAARLNISVEEFRALVI